jgi:hypothetical protein
VDINGGTALAWAVFPDLVHKVALGVSHAHPPKFEGGSESGGNIMGDETRVDADCGPSGTIL